MGRETRRRAGSSGAVAPLGPAQVLGAGWMRAPTASRGVLDCGRRLPRSSLLASLGVPGGSESKRRGGGMGAQMVRRAASRH